jgi:Protein of unknown function (DUF3606)
MMSKNRPVRKSSSTRYISRSSRSVGVIDGALRIATPAVETLARVALFEARNGRPRPGVGPGIKGGDHGKREENKPRPQPGPRPVAGGQDYEVRYTAKKTDRSGAAVKKAAKKVGSSRKKVERRLSR